jgi:hypothetical protein
MGPALAQILFQSQKRGAPEGDDALLVALAADVDTAEVEGKIAGGEGGDLGDAESAGIEELEDGAVAEVGGAGLGVIGGELGAVEHFSDLRLGEGLGEDLPGLGGFDVDGGVVVDAAVEHEPLVETAEATELAGDGAGVDGVDAEVLHECGDVLLGGGEEDAVAGLEELGEGVEVAGVGFAGEGTKAFFYAEVDLIVHEKRQVAGGVHSPDYRRVGGGSAGVGGAAEPDSSRNQGGHWRVFAKA